MDDNGGLGIRNWGYYEQTIKGNLGLQLMSSIANRDARPLLSESEPGFVVPVNSAFLHRDCGVPETHVPLDLIRESWISHRDKLLHQVPSNQNYEAPSLTSGPHYPLQIFPQPDSFKDERAPQMDLVAGRKDNLMEKHSNGRACKPPRVKKADKLASQDKSKSKSKSSVSRAKPEKRSAGAVINGMDLDISCLPIPVCSCTGAPQQCYKWGIGGWQSACCTTNMSTYPLPMSTKRRGARIAGRKMSLGAFKKVLEKLDSEGNNLSNPIDLKTYWAKHGTNKFVTIR